MEPKRIEPKEAKTTELRPDGEERFEKAIDIAIKTPAIRREKPSIVKRKP